MNNLKKIGVTALAGSLMSLSVSAGEMAVTGTAEITYTTNDSTGTGATSVGNPFGMKNNITFKGSGDVNGYGVSYQTTMNDAGSATVSTLLTVDMGAMGLVGIDQGMGSFGVDTADDSILPTAYEEPSHGGGSGSLGITGSSNVLGYKNSFMGLNLNVEYNPDYSLEDNADGVYSGTIVDNTATTTVNEALESTTKGASLNYVVSMEVADGLTIGAGAGTTEGNKQTTGSPDAEEALAYAKYSSGPVSVGYFMNESQNNTLGADGKNTEGYSIAFAVNDSLSISYASRELEVDDGDTSNNTEDSTGVMASYTMGGASLRLAHNEHDSVGGVTGTNSDNTEVSLVLAF
jgi:outer membrane protein OmpU